MPALPFVAGGLRCRLQFTDSNSNVFGSRFYLKYSGGPPSASDVSTLAANIAAHWATVMSALQPTYITLTEVIALDLSSATGYEEIWSGSHAGTRSGTGLPEDVAVNIGFSIGRHYRGGKPKIFIPAGVTTDTASPRTWSAAFLTAVNTAWGTFMADVLADTYASMTLQDNVNISYYEGFTVQTSPSTGRARNVPTRRAAPVVDNITNHNAVAIYGSQRRRLRAA